MCVCFVGYPNAEDYQRVCICWHVHLSARCPELPLKKLQLHLDTNSWKRQHKQSLHSLTVKLSLLSMCLLPCFYERMKNTFLIIFVKMYSFDALLSFTTLSWAFVDIDRWGNTHDLGGSLFQLCLCVNVCVMLCQRNIKNRTFTGLDLSRSTFPMLRCNSIFAVGTDLLNKYQSLCQSLMLTQR